LINNENYYERHDDVKKLDSTSFRSDVIVVVLSNSSIAGAHGVPSAPPNGEYRHTVLKVNEATTRKYNNIAHTPADKVKSSFKVWGKGGGTPGSYTFSWTWTLSSEKGSIPNVSGSGGFSLGASQEHLTAQLSTSVDIPQNAPKWVKINQKLTVFFKEPVDNEWVLSPVYNWDRYWHLDGHVLPDDEDLL